MGVAECGPHEASAPPHALCVVCKEAAAQRCEDCCDEEEGHLYLCAKDACFDATHNVRNSGKHRKSLVAWNSKAKWTDKCCETHKGDPLALWCSTCATLVCALCCSHGEHNGHETRLVTDAWKGLQAQLRATVDYLEEENVRSRERLRRLTEEQEELRSGKGAVGDARRILHEMKAELLAKVEALDVELDEAAVKWCRLAGEEHEQLARHTRGVQSLVDGMRATCAEENAEGAQRVVIAHTELCARRDVLGFAPPVSVRVVEFESDTLRQAVADLRVRAVDTATTPLCMACGASLREFADPCAACAEAVRVFEESGGDLRSASIGLQANKNVVLAAVAKDGLSLEYVQGILRNDTAVVMAAVAQNGLSLIYAHEYHQADREVVITAVTQNGLALEYANHHLRADVQVVIAAVAADGSSLKYADSKLKSNRQFVTDAVALSCASLLYSEFRGDKEIVMTAVTGCGALLDYVTLEMREDKEVVMAAVAQDGVSLRHATRRFKAEKDVVMTAVAQSGRALQFASESLKANKEVVTAAVAQCGLALQHADERLRANKQVVLAAVAQAGRALQYASSKTGSWFGASNLRADKSVVVAAINQDARSFAYASDKLKANKEFVMEVVALHDGALVHASEELKADRDVVLAAGAED